MNAVRIINRDNHDVGLTSQRLAHPVSYPRNLAAGCALDSSP